MSIKARDVPSVVPTIDGVENGDDAPNEPDGEAETAWFHLH
jgi:hypothetical protein